MSRKRRHCSNEKIRIVKLPKIKTVLKIFYVFTAECVKVDLKRLVQLESEQIPDHLNLIVNVSRLLDTSGTFTEARRLIPISTRATKIK